MDANEGSLTLDTRFDLAIKAFEHTAAYDSMIANCTTAAWFRPTTVKAKSRRSLPAYAEPELH